MLHVHCTGLNVVLLRFSKSGKRTVSGGFVKKSADSDSVSDSRQRHYKLIYTGNRAQRLSTGGKCGDDARLRRSFLGGKTQRNHRPTCRVLDTPRTHARGRPTPHPPLCKPPHTDARRCTMPKTHATHHEVQYLMACIESCNSNCNFNYNLFNRTHEFFIPYIDR